MPYHDMLKITLNRSFDNALRTLSTAQWDPTAMIVMAVIFGIIGLILVAWFIVTLNAIRDGIDRTSKALWKIANKDSKDPEPEEKTEDTGTVESTSEAKPAEKKKEELLNSVDKERLKTIELVRDLKVFAVTRKEIERNGEKAYILELRISSDGIEPAKTKTVDINQNEYTKLELDKAYTREELKLNSK